MLTQIHHKKNELQEVEFYQDKECTEAFDFIGKKNLYIELKDGDISPLLYIDQGDTNGEKLFVPYINKYANIPQQTFDCCGIGIWREVLTLDDITPNLSKYIPEDNAVLFLSEEDKEMYCNALESNICLFSLKDLKIWNFKYLNDSGEMETPQKATIFLYHGTQSELQKANEVEKELKEKYGVKEVNLFALHWFYKRNDFREPQLRCDKLITTNSTGILPIQDKERLQVVDCKEIFEEYLKENN
jgi:hypothetical protein